MLFRSEKNYEILQVSIQYQGKEEEEKLKNIIKDIYRYYGVSEEDKEKGSERFLMLATILEAV